MHDGGSVKLSVACNCKKSDEMMKLQAVSYTLIVNSKLGSPVVPKERISLTKIFANSLDSLHFPWRCH